MQVNAVRRLIDNFLGKNTGDTGGERTMLGAWERAI